MSLKRVIVGVSGGVDSAVTALLLKRKGYDVHGVFMKNWDLTEETGSCTSVQDAADAEWVCKHVGVPFHVVNFVREYWHEVFSELLVDYQLGLTPNPDILCNRQIKFNLFYKYARDKLRADAISTGHYARTTFGGFLEDFDENKDVRLLKAVDSFKDQTFFLSQVRQHALRRTMFPLGLLTKAQVRNIARAEGMANIEKKKESMGICFIGSRNFQHFISDYVTAQPGYFVDVESGVTVGEHRGIHHWTVGQRCKIGGQLNPYYVVKKDAKSPDILVANSTDHASLYTRLLLTTRPHWIHSVPEPLRQSGYFECHFRFQHTKALTKCRITPTSSGELMVMLDSPLRAITRGQYAVFYKDQECLGSARICGTGPSLYALGGKWPADLRGRQYSHSAVAAMQGV